MIFQTDFYGDSAPAGGGCPGISMLEVVDRGADNAARGRICHIQNDTIELDKAIERHVHEFCRLVHVNVLKECICNTYAAVQCNGNRCSFAAPVCKDAICMCDRTG